LGKLLIHQYLNDLDRLKSASGSVREGVVSEAFKDLLKAGARQHDLIFVPQHELETPAKERRYVDGALLYSLRVPFGYWEAKDEKDDLDAEIDFKFRRGYPQDNIIFEDSRTAVLIQNRKEVMRCLMQDIPRMEKLLELFFGYQRPEIAEFRKAVEQLKADLPAVLAALRDMIEAAERDNDTFRTAEAEFLAHAQEAINPSLITADVREMLIQHILTEELFTAVFPGTPFHQDNNVARELYKLEHTFFVGNTKFATLKALGPYYAAIRATAAQISSHSEKQTFLKVIYENFYKVYNVKAADRLGVVYTPNEIVRFMIQGADWLCEKHFGRNLVDRDVDILDPATGTGTFICELIEHFRGQPAKLRQKYKHELHANEVAILPYYVANLNIEATYAAVTGEYEEFPGLCFVDTLDNTVALRKHRGHIDDLFGGVSDDNVRRIRQQNSRRISVIIGNPPYNANQLNENENNKNREYPEIDKRIKETYIAASTAQKTKLYDMYARFFRWASDRLDENGVLALITNRSFIASRTFDGFRAIVAKEFAEIRIVDLGGDVRSNPKLSGTTHNVFGIQTGVAISFLVRKAKHKGCRIYYSRRPEFETAEEKLAFLASAGLGDLAFEEIAADAKSDWIDIASNDFDTLLPLVSPEAKSADSAAKARVIFKLFSNGVVTARDDWAYDFDSGALRTKVAHFCRIYTEEQSRWAAARPQAKTTDELYSALGDFVSREIKWTSELEAHLDKGTALRFSSTRVRIGAYRPYVHMFNYYARVIAHRIYQQDRIFPVDGTWQNRAIGFSGLSSSKPFQVLAVDRLPSFDLLEKTQFLPLRRTESGTCVENITDWALDQFRKHYQPGRGKKDRPITKEAIFHYVYAVLHDPVYREKYAINLKREFPRIPFYLDFWQWADWGRTLMDLHIGYESVPAFQLKRVDILDDKARKAGLAPKSILKADKAAGRIILDSETILSDVPAGVWEYKLGNRSALEWILDQYKEKKPKDPTIREKFNTYRFADHKEKVVDLLMRVTTVSVETMQIVNEMRAVPRQQ
jgi:predicted helicase